MLLDKGQSDSLSLTAKQPARHFLLFFPPYKPWIPSLSKFSSVQLLSRVRLCDPMDCSRPGFSVITNSRSLLKLMSESVIPSNHLIPCHPLLLPSISPSIRVFSSESVLCIRWPKYWSFSFSISPSNEYSGLISFRMDWSRVFSNTTVQKHQFFVTQLSLWSSPHIHTWLLEKP